MDKNVVSADASVSTAPDAKVVDNDSQRHPILHYLFWAPKWCHWHADNPPPLTIWLNLLYAFASGFTSANLFYSHPILNVLANDFHTTQSGVATIPTLAQAGNAVCLVFILPLADFFPRRRFTLVLIALSAIFWIGLCITNDFNVFLVLTFLSALFTGATQIMLPLVAEQSTPERRAFSISIVGTGPTLGILLARILSGIVANYTSWRNVYWMALGLQVLVLLALWAFMPDYPSTNSLPLRQLLKQYPRILWSIFTLYPKHPVLVHASLLSFCTFFTLTAFWTTLTFLLAGPPYHYNSAIIGLFGLVGAATLVIGPMYSKYIITPLREPIFSVIVGSTISLIGILIGTYAGKVTVVAPILQAFLQDAGLMVTQIANRMAIYPVEPLGRNRVNTAFVLIMYLGQLAGTKGGNDVYERYGGWIAAGSLNVAIMVFSYILAAARGPHESGWVGWSGGWGLRPKVKQGDSEEAGSVAGDPVEMCNRSDAERNVESEEGGVVRTTSPEASGRDVEVDMPQTQAAIAQDHVRRRSKG